MIRLLRSLSLVIALFAAGSARSFADEPAAASDLLVVCGWDEVFVIDASDAEAGDAKKLWSWRAADCETLPASLRGRFGSTDECKPIDGGAAILIASSGGACALVERASGRAVWHAAVPNAHSIELLPGRRVIAAASVAESGNRLLLFDLAKSDEPLWSDALPSAHGVVWDEGRRCVWALGFDELRRYELVDWETAKPSLRLANAYPLPDDGGHDLQAVPRGNDLTLTTHEHVYRFDRETHEFRADAQLGDRAQVKCVSSHPTSGRIAVVQASDEAWWTDSIDLLEPTGRITLKDEKLYKIRWLTTNE